MFDFIKNAFDFAKSAIGIREGVNTRICADSMDVSNVPTIMESPVMQTYIDGNLTGNTVAKKLTAAAITVANEKGYISLPEKYADQRSIASIADKTVETVKLAHDVATGKLDADYVADYTIKKGAGVLKTIVGGFVKKGAAIAAHAITTAVVSVFPPAVVIAPAIHAATQFVGHKVKQVISKGINKIAEAVKPVVRRAVETVKNVAVKTFNKVKNGVKKFFNWIYG